MLYQVPNLNMTTIRATITKKFTILQENISKLKVDDWYQIATENMNLACFELNWVYYYNLTLYFSKTVKCYYMNNFSVVSKSEVIIPYFTKYTWWHELLWLILIYNLMKYDALPDKINLSSKSLVPFGDLIFQLDRTYTSLLFPLLANNKVLQLCQYIFALEYTENFWSYMYLGCPLIVKHVR